MHMKYIRSMFAYVTDCSFGWGALLLLFLCYAIGRWTKGNQVKGRYFVWKDGIHQLPSHVRMILSSREGKHQSIRDRDYQSRNAESRCIPLCLTAPNATDNGDAVAGKSECNLPENQ